MTNRRIPRIRVFAAESVRSLIDVLPLRRRYFTLLLAWDEDPLEQRALVPLFAPLVDRGLAYFCAWGTNCELVHDAVDRSAVRRESAGGLFNYVSITTWHDKEPLEDAAWFFENGRFRQNRMYSQILIVLQWQSKIRAGPVNYCEPWARNGTVSSPCRCGPCPSATIDKSTRRASEWNPW